MTLFPRQDIFIHSRGQDLNKSYGGTTQPVRVSISVKTWWSKESSILHFPDKGKGVHREDLHFLWPECYLVVVVQLPSHVWLFATPWTTACQASQSITISWSLPKFMFTALVMLSCHLILWCPLLLLPSIFPRIRVFPISQLFTSGGQSIGTSASTSVLPMNTQLISCRMDWFDLLAVQRTFKSLLQHHILKASILWHLAFFMVQL